MSDHETDSNEQPAAPTAAGPVLGVERISSLDILRGVAILGILVMNIYAFAMPFPSAYYNPLLMGGTDALNLGIWFFTHILFDEKFLSIFAMLFGAGIVLMTSRAEARGARYGRIFFRRQFWLVLIGAMHAYFIWDGDILFYYAVIGMLAYLFRNRTPRTLIIVACCLLPISLLMTFGMGGLSAAFQEQSAEVIALREAGESLTAEQEQLLEQMEETRAMLAPTAADLQKEVAIHRGSYAAITAHRIPLVMQMQAFIVFLILGRVLALMLIGMALIKTGVLSAERSASFYRKMMLISYGIGMPLTAFSAIDRYAHNFDQLYIFQAGGVPNYFGSIIVGLGHIGLVMLLIKTGFVQGLLQRFASVGRMALTNYLMHSVILTTVFYGYGFGLYGEIERFSQMGFVVAVIALQLVLSPWWLARYRFGPVEWLGRSLTYWKRQPMVRE